MADGMTAGPARPGPPPSVVFLHFLGGSADSWNAVENSLSGRLPCRPLDLPGFGASPHRDGQPVAEMADAVTAALVAAGLPERWLLAGHSMGAKVALLLARRAENGDAALSGLCGLVLVAGSPPAPEPMEDAKREEMLGWFGGDDAANRRDADRYVRNNVGDDLHPERHAATVADVLRAERHAWQHWLVSGSREDLRGEIGVLRLPALVLAGEQDEALGAEAQRALTLPHLARHRFETLSGVAHLLPIEAPETVARLIADFADAIPAMASSGPDEARMTTRTRDLLAQRAAVDRDAETPRALSASRFACLRAVVARVLPHDLPGIDLARQIDAMLASGEGDGWRFAVLPPDAEAYAAGLDTLDARAGGVFAERKPAEQDAVLGAAMREEDGPGPLSAPALSCWLEDLRGDAAKLLLAHPEAMRAIACDAYSNGTDAELFGFDGMRSVAPTGVAS